MPHYDYDKDYPFAAFITNLGKYNEGALVGEWVKFPTTAEELKKVFERIGIGAKDDFGQTYEEWFITDYDCYVDGLYDLLGDRHNAPSFAAAPPAVHRISAVRGGFCCVSRQNLCRGGPAVCRYFTTPRAKCKALALRGRISCWFCFLFSKGCVIM